MCIRDRLGAISDFCGLNWDKNEICNRTLILEQLLATGGGWQDQYGGVLRGVKLLQTHAGMDQSLSLIHIWKFHETFLYSKRYGTDKETFHETSGR